MLRFDRDRAWAMLGEDRAHAGAQAGEIVYFDSNLFIDPRRIDLALAEPNPGEIIQKEIWPGLVRQTLPAEIVNLDMVEIGLVAQNAQPLAWLAQRDRAWRG